AEKFGDEHFHARRRVRVVRHGVREMALEEVLELEVCFELGASCGKAAILAFSTGGREHAVGVNLVPEGSIDASQTLQAFTCGGGMADAHSKGQGAKVKGLGNFDLTNLGSGGAENMQGSDD